MRRISIGPGEVAGYLGQLRNGFEGLGIACEHFMFIPPHQYSYPTTDYFLRSAYESVAKLEQTGRLGYLIYKLSEKVIRLVALIYAIFRYDTFIFSGLGSFFRFWELPLLRALGKRVIVVYLGSDARPPYLSGRHLDDKNGTFDSAAIAREAAAIKKQIRFVERYASVVVSHTSTAQFMARPFVRLCAVGIPMGKAPEKVGKAAARDPGDPHLRILHAPSRPVAKGTPLVREVVGKLQEEGAKLELVELTGVPNHEVLRQLQLCDLVVDELYSDIPMATLAAEAAGFSKPVVVGSLYGEHFTQDNPDFAAGEDAPSFFIGPEQLEQTLRSLIADPSRLRDKGEQARRFLATHWVSEIVASNYLRLANADVPESWRADPATIGYIAGWGLSRENWATQLRQYVLHAGEGALLLDDKPGLKGRITDVLEGRASL
jgi:glycosyltransferase involved in cell wall biosynthesis